MQFGFHSGLFNAYLKRVDTAVTDLYQQRAEAIADSGQQREIIIDTKIPQWRNTWSNAYDGLFDVNKADLLQYGLLLGRLAETYSAHLVAEEILNRLAESASRR